MPPVSPLAVAGAFWPQFPRLQLLQQLSAFLTWGLICSTVNTGERSIRTFHYCASYSVQPSWGSEKCMGETSQTLEVVLFYTYEDTMDARWVQPIHAWPAVKDEFYGQQIMQNRPRTTIMPLSIFLLCVFQVHVSGFVFCPSEHIPIWYMDGKGPRAELKLCLYNLWSQEIHLKQLKDLQKHPRT